MVKILTIQLSVQLMHSVQLQLGYQINDEDDTATGGTDYETEIYAISFMVNDNFSVLMVSTILKNQVLLLIKKLKYSSILFNGWYDFNLKIVK